MARTTRSSTTIEEVVRRRTVRYFWPQPTLNFWVFIMVATAGVIMGVFGAFINIQNRFGVGIPWLFPYGVTVGALLAVFVIALLLAMPFNALLPIYVIVGAFVLFVLFLTGLIETSIQLFGSGGNVNTNCQNYVFHQPVRGVSLNTLAWLEQQTICQSWYAAFAFWIIGDVFLIWIMIIAAAANQNQLRE